MEQHELPALPPDDDAEALALPPDDCGFEVEHVGLLSLPELPEDDGQSLPELPPGGGCSKQKKKMQHSAKHKLVTGKGEGKAKTKHKSIIGKGEAKTARSGPYGMQAALALPEHRVRYGPNSDGHLLRSLSAFDLELQDDFMEVFSSPRLVPHMQHLGFRAQLSIDVTSGWDLSDKATQNRLLQEIQRRRPKVIHLCCPCTVFSCMQNLNTGRRKDPEKAHKEFLQAAALFDFSMQIASMQIYAKRGFSHEHPDRATSWQRQTCKALLAQPEVSTSKFDQCMFGLKTPFSLVPMQKTTIFGSNIKALHDKFKDGRCDHGHEHHICHGTERGVRLTRWAEKYPEQLCATMAESYATYLQTTS